MVDVAQVIPDIPLEEREKVLSALKILVEQEFFQKLARVNKNQLVDDRFDSFDELALAAEVREVRQTNLVLAILEQSARQLTMKGDDNEA